MRYRTTAVTTVVRGIWGHKRAVTLTGRNARVARAQGRFYLPEWLVRCIGNMLRARQGGPNDGYLNLTEHEKWQADNPEARYDYDAALDEPRREGGKENGIDQGIHPRQ